MGNAQTLSSVAFGLRAGYENLSPGYQILYNSRPNKRDLNFKVRAFTVVSTFPIPLTNMTFAKVLRCAPYIPLQSKHLKMITGAIGLLALGNYFALFWPQNDDITLKGYLYKKDLPQAANIFEKIVIVIWKTTPYLMVITNLALLALEFRLDRVRAVTELVITGITVIPFIKPSWSTWINTPLSLASDATGLYYGSDLVCVQIVYRRGDQVLKMVGL